MTRVSTFTDDALGDFDAVGLAAEMAAGRIHPAESVAASLARAARASELDAIVLTDPDRAFRDAHQPLAGPFAGVPTFVKDDTDVAGWPTRCGCDGIRPRPAAAHAAVIQQIFSTGVLAIGKSRLPEFGWMPSTEFEKDPPTRNPWNTDYSPGGSSGGAAALVASGVVPIAHARDGGGSIRIPAAACGLVGLKFTRGREAKSADMAHAPVDVVSDGIVSRSVRDTAVFATAIDRLGSKRALQPISEVTGPGRRRTIGMVIDSPTGVPTDDETRAAVENTATVLEAAGHRVVEMDVQRLVDPEFEAAFLHYWGFLAYAALRAGRLAFGKGWDPTRADAVTHGLAARFRSNWRYTPRAIRVLRDSEAVYQRAFDNIDLVLSPTLTHTTPPLGHIAPTVPIDELVPRLVAYTGFTPANNAAGGPAISLPLGMTNSGLPIGVHFSAAHGDEQALLEIAFETEEAIGFPTLA